MGNSTILKTFGYISTPNTGQIFTGNQHSGIFTTYTLKNFRYEEKNHTTKKEIITATAT